MNEVSLLWARSLAAVWPSSSWKNLQLILIFSICIIDAQTKKPMKLLICPKLSRQQFSKLINQEIFRFFGAIKISGRRFFCHVGNFFVKWRLNFFLSRQISQVRAKKLDYTICNGFESSFSMSLRSLGNFNCDIGT